MLMTIQEKENEIIENFQFLENWEERYSYIIDLGKQLPEMSAKKKIDNNLIRGCQSKVWLDAYLEGDILHFEADSDGILPKGIAALLVELYSGQPVKDILAADFSFIEKIGLHEFLSPSRANGLMAMIQQIKYYAVAYQSKLNR